MMENRICSNCKTALPPEAKFCPDCGTKATVVGMVCPQCTAANPLGTAFCGTCGFKLLDPPAPDIFTPPPSDEWEQRLADLFMMELERSVLDQQDARMVDQYFQRFHESGYARDLNLRLQQLARTLTRDQAEEITQEIHFELFDQVDYFLVRHCADLNKVYLPEAILKYSKVDLEQTDLYRMAMDHLAFDHEDVRIYTDFLAMPERTLKNASKTFLFADRTEQLWFICDQSLAGSGKVGFAMTNQSLYWKAPTQLPHVFRYGHPLEIEFEQNWLNLNGAFFDGGKAINVRLSKLLRRLQAVF
jgi:ribosomal protein L40E